MSISVKNSLATSKYLRDFDIVQEKLGKHVLYQSKFYTKEQFTAIRQQSIPIVFLFGDNEDDNTRDRKTKARSGASGQAKVAGSAEFEGFISMGIITVWNSKCGIEEKIARWENSFRELLAKIQRGCTIVVPSPAAQELKANYSKFHDISSGKQVIFHSLGTGIAGAPLTDLFVLQQFLDNLENGIVDKSTIDYSPINNPLLRTTTDPAGYVKKPVVTDNVDDKDKLIARLREGLQKLRDQNIEASKRHEREMGDLKKEMALTLASQKTMEVDDQDNNANIANENSRLKAEVKRLQTEITILRNDNKQLDQDMKNLQSQMSSVLQENDQLKQTIDSFSFTKDDNYTSSQTTQKKSIVVFDEPKNFSEDKDVDMQERKEESKMDSEDSTSSQQVSDLLFQQDQEKWDALFREEIKGHSVNCWYRKTNDGEDKPYNLPTSARIEALQIRERFFEGDDGDDQVEIVKESTDKGTEFHLATKQKLNIFSQKKDLTTVPPLPSWWSTNSSFIMMGDVSICSFDPNPDWVSFLVDQITTSVTDKTVKQVQLVKNMQQWSKYALNQLLWSHKQLPENQFNEKRLWFGVNGDSWKKICLSGFSDFRRKNDLGEGVFFYQSPKDALAQKDVSPAGGFQYLICALVTCGEICIRTNNKRRLKRGTTVEYESYVDDEKNPTLFISKFNGQTYPFLLFKLL